MLRDGPYPWSLKERILGPFGHLSNGDVGRLLEKGLGKACRQVVLAHLSKKNNHPELALQAAEEALDRAGRRAGAVVLGAPGGAPGSGGPRPRWRGSIPSCSPPTVSAPGVPCRSPPCSPRSAATPCP